MKKLVTAATLIAAVGIFPAVADAHELTVNRAHHKTLVSAKNWCIETGRCYRYGAGDCVRRSDHRVNCEARVRTAYSGVDGSGYEDWWFMYIDTYRVIWTLDGEQLRRSFGKSTHDEVEIPPSDAEQVEEVVEP